ncbi:asparagine synthase-related protein [Salegentibacter sp. F188]|uniref:asparagine synthase (glutamine-hydrolyzing) n=1 Tax=Autumnicola patrickiae TaxID=3075591 RepID=A0ABU3E580_9FLAO|nr:asparagine synthase-related protein [Salegentibacter sp. F188]MDT0690794.1 asparagine synthase-related protein [Salegentibacter sp. F188]
MSDFIFSKKSFLKDQLALEIKKILTEEKLEITEFHGSWGSLAVSKNLYNGFLPIETEEHIFVVLGGPVLNFTANSFISSENGNKGTRQVYDRWQKGKIKWDEDLSGAFALLIVDKGRGELLCVTDLLSFIPVYLFKDKNDLFLSSHVDVLANVADRQMDIDVVSRADFILTGVVTFPFTMYTSIKQLLPATVYVHKEDEETFNSKTYWIPTETNFYTSVETAATDVRESIERYIEIVCDKTIEVAQFISGGEDSRLVAALLPENIKRDAFVFLDSMNREGILAQKAAKIYGANFKLASRTKNHYLQILPAASRLVGSGAEYMHAHSYGFHQSCQLKKYNAVFGGLFADAFLKGARIPKEPKTRFGARVKQQNPQLKKVQHKLFSTEVLEEVNKRRKTHIDLIEKMRPQSATEWFNFWPISMHESAPNIHANRRLFRSYEPFTSGEIVKISARIPQEWKLNRLLFHRVAKPLLKPSKWLMHNTGRLPYFPDMINRFIALPLRYMRKLRETREFRRRNHGPWAQWDVLAQSNEWRKMIEKYSEGLEKINENFKGKSAEEIYRHFNVSQKFRLLQVTEGISSAKSKP